jgi:uncharacterized membrane protein
MFHALTTLAIVIHVGGGTIGLVSGTIAIFARKGGALHRKAGTVFVVSMLIMAVFAAYLGVAVPDQLVNLVIGTLTFYLVATAWMAVWRREGAVGLPEKIAFGIILVVLAPFAILAFQLATGMEPLFKSAVPYKGPVTIAVYGFTSVMAIAAIADAKMLVSGGISGAPRIARHLWRMCLGLTLAAGSAFTNGLPRLLPGPLHVPPAFFVPQFLPLILLIFWMIRVRFTGWFKHQAAISPMAAE